jgi:hypothetical protein
VNGRTRPGPNWATCPCCDRTVCILVDGTLETHTPTGDPYAPACKGRRPDNTRLRAVVRGGLGAFVLVVTLGVAVFADRAPDRLDVRYGTAPTGTTETGQ